MSLHPSLKIDKAAAQQRTVLTRIERIKDLMKKGLWEDGRQVIKLPKTKVIRIKTKKEKAEKAPEEGASVEGAAPVTPTEETKAAAPKAAAPKAAAKATKS